MDRHRFFPRCGELEPREGKRSHPVTVAPKGLGSLGPLSSSQWAEYRRLFGVTGPFQRWLGLLAFCAEPSEVSLWRPGPRQGQHAGHSVVQEPSPQTEPLAEATYLHELLPLFPGPPHPLLYHGKGPRGTLGALLSGLGWLCPPPPTQLSLKRGKQGGLKPIPLGQRCDLHLHTNCQGG